MRKLRQGFSWWCVANRGVENADLLAGAAKIGYEAVDLVGAELWPLVKERA
jgi:hydroxypyruvate isomerase